MIILLIIIFVIIATLALLEEEENNIYNTYIYWGIGIFLLLTASLREVGLDHDSTNYEYVFTHTNSPLLGLMEFSFLFISNIINFFADDVHVLFFVYACLGVLLKLKAIKELSPFYFLPLIIYFSNYFMLHEMTQIRAGVAASMLLMSIRPLSEGRKLTATFWILLALFFHYSSAILIPILFLSPNEMSIRSRQIWGGLIPLVYLLYLLHIDFILSLPIPFINDKIEIYRTFKDKGILGDDLNVFNYLQLLRISIFYFTLYYYDLIKQYNKFLPILTKMMAISIASYVFLSGIPVIAIRISELFGVVDIIMFVNIYYTIKPSYLPKAIIILIAIALFYMDIAMVGLFDPSKAPAFNN